MTDELDKLGSRTGGLCLEPVLSVNGHLLVPGYHRGYRWRPRRVSETGVDEAGSSLAWHLSIRHSDNSPQGINLSAMRDVRWVDRKDRVQRAADFISALLHATMVVSFTASVESQTPAESLVL